MTRQSEDLALTVINTNNYDFQGASYEARCGYARLDHEFQASLWNDVAKAAARWYVKKFDSEPFTAVDILLCAAELAEYYAEHITEMDAA